MSNYKLSYRSFGEFAILIEWPSKINEAILADIIGFANTPIVWANTYSGGCCHSSRNPSTGCECNVGLYEAG